MQVWSVGLNFGAKIDLKNWPTVKDQAPTVKFDDNTVGLNNLRIWVWFD